MLMVFIKKWSTSLIVIFLGIVMICICLATFSRKIENSIEVDMRDNITKTRDNAIYTFVNEVKRISDYLVDEARVLGRMKDFTEAEVFDEINSFSQVHGLEETTLLTLDGFAYLSQNKKKLPFDVGIIDENQLVKKGEVTSPNMSHDSAGTHLEVSTPIFLKDKAIAILYIRYNSTMFEEVFAKNFMKEDCLIGLTTSKGVMLAGSGILSAKTTPIPNMLDFFSKANISFAEGNAQIIRSDLEALKSGFAIYSRKNVTRYISYAPVGVNDWYISAISSDGALITQTDEMNAFAFHLVVELFVIVSFIVGWVVIARARENKRHLSELSRVAYIDSLTGAANRKWFQMTASKLLLEKENQYAFVVLDIDKFKVLNDTLGYESGDRLLCIIADNLQANMELGETFGRCDSDEYYMLLKYHDNESIKQRVTTFFSEIQMVFNKQLLNNYNLVLCVGIYAVTDLELMINVIMDRAKHAHQMAKGGSSSCIAFYSEELHSRILGEKNIENMMYSALKNNNFLLFLQPKYALIDEKLCGAEALVRWDTVDSPMLFPDQFIPVFEKTGFITKLDMYMLEKSCILIKSWIEKGITPIPVSINFSRIHLMNANFVGDIAAIVKRYNVPPKFIEIELTESTMMHNEDLLIKVLSQLHEYGFALSMDDFGSGYSSLGLLKNLPVDTIKMDRTFFTEYNDLARAKTVISNMILMAKELGIFTVAEGVETKEHIELLRELGCDIVQGYYFAKPMKTPDFNKLLGINSEI